MMSILLSVLFHLSYIFGIFVLGYIFGKKQAQKNIIKVQSSKIAN